MKSSRLQQLFNFLEKAPQDAFTLYSIAYEYMRMKDFENALHYFRELEAINPSYIGTYYHLGKTLEALGQTEEAINTYQKGMTFSQQQKDFHTLRELKAALNNIEEIDDEYDI